MALFKVSKGATGNLSKQGKVDGYCWFTPDDGKFYIDSTTSGSGSTLQRIPLSADKADRDKLGNNIIETYPVKIVYDNNTISLQNYKDDIKSSISLGALAKLNGLSTTNAAIKITPTTTNVFNSSSVDNNGVLSFQTISVWNGYDSATTASYAYGQTLTPMEGDTPNGDNVDF